MASSSLSAVISGSLVKCEILYRGKRALKLSRIVAEGNKSESETQRRKGLTLDTSKDKQDIKIGKAHSSGLNSYDYVSTALRQYAIDDISDDLYISPAFMDKVVTHITKNFMTLPNIKVPLILGIWGGKGQGKSFQCELVFAKMGIKPVMMSAGKLERDNSGELAKLIRQQYREAAAIIAKGNMCCLFINDLDAGRLGANSQIFTETLLKIVENPSKVQLPEMDNKEENTRVPIIVTGNDFSSTLYEPLIGNELMEKFYWEPNREDRFGVCRGIFTTDNVTKEDIVKLVDTFPGQSIDFFGALRTRVYDDEVRKWISEIGFDKVEKRLMVSSKEGGLPTVEKPAMDIDKLLKYGNLLIQEQEAALRDPNQNFSDTGNFYGQAAQQLDFPIPEGCTDRDARNFDPTARSDDGSCLYQF